MVETPLSTTRLAVADARIATWRLHSRRPESPFVRGCRADKRRRRNHAHALEAMIFASVPVLQAPDQMQDTVYAWKGCGPELLIIDNTTAGDWCDLAKEHGWSYRHFARNLGVCASWNVARAWFLNQPGLDHDCLFLFSASVRFDDGLPAVLNQLAEAANWKGCQTQYAGHAMAYSRRLLQQAGTWDENFWPGYFGDNDYWYRGICDGWLRAGPDAMPQIKINAPEPEDGRALRMTGMISNTAACGAYYEYKHGGPPSEERFSTPFDSGLPTSWWSPCYRPGMEQVNIGETRYR